METLCTSLYLVIGKVIGKNSATQHHWGGWDSLICSLLLSEMFSLSLLSSLCIYFGSEPVREIEPDCIDDHSTPKNPGFFKGNMPFYEEKIRKKWILGHALLIDYKEIGISFGISLYKPMDRNPVGRRRIFVIGEIEKRLGEPVLPEMLLLIDEGRRKLFGDF